MEEGGRQGEGASEPIRVAIRLVSSPPFPSVCSRRRQKLTKGKAGEGSVQSCRPLISVCLKVV